MAVPALKSKPRRETGSIDLAELYREFYPPLKAYALRFFNGDNANAEDATAETFLHAVRSYDTFQIGTNLRGWLYRIARNACIDYYNAERKRGGAEFLIEPSIEPTTYPDLERHLHHLLEQVLPEPFREVVRLDMLGYRYREISEMLDIPMGTVMSRLHRARNYLTPYREDFL